MRRPTFRLLRYFLFVVWSPTMVCHGEDRLNPSVKQLVVGIAPNWDSMHGYLLRLDRTSTGWKAAGPAAPVLFGKQGLAWGRGVFSGVANRKAERDKKAPAGLFKIGTIYTYDHTLPPGSTYPFHTVGAGDGWVDDVNSLQYNQHVVVDPKNPPPWFAKQRMRHNDFAYRWLVEIRHNSDPPVPGDGSAIFFHIRRGADRPSAGCTTMAEVDLIKLIRWLRPEANPEYLCLPKSEYLARWNEWDLPAPSLIIHQ
jgi:L,D-peptidoglycan transpeptidase YkuD (ErfK/YbiS/YcfS/YnhG family)